MSVIAKSITTLPQHLREKWFSMPVVSFSFKLFLFFPLIAVPSCQQTAAATQLKFFIRRTEQDTGRRAPLWRLHCPEGTSHQLPLRQLPSGHRYMSRCVCPSPAKRARISHRKTLAGRLSKIQRQTQPSAVELISNPEMKVQSWHYSHDRPEKTHSSSYSSKKKKLFMLWKPSPTPACILFSKKRKRLSCTVLKRFNTSGLEHIYIFFPANKL